jgi:hypothetical protein
MRAPAYSGADGTCVLNGAAAQGRARGSRRVLWAWAKLLAVQGTPIFVTFQVLLVWGTRDQGFEVRVLWTWAEPRQDVQVLGAICVFLFPDMLAKCFSILETRRLAA